ncbi:molecular chaperone TorD family protein [Vibrio sp. SS-MA-C1-2]|uniref:molecular chaperone TorD family protein n=1 Tax=Vibrio sp. SS-MA-C1-2 TaxID=2908646 RepID=UPI001F15D428|nr:molecular chaperone TorD family protein [Vibrio sp. SS-MA-C1-2]UJF16904.1 molecular chaperone TorD family protein [Vibrio sp. SS-MA-C1-2]
MIIDTAKLLGALFYQKCSKSELLEILSALASEGVVSKTISQSLIPLSEEELTTIFSELFEGMGEMVAPPWGSVYLDREKVLFGESTLSYRHFLQSNEMILDTNLREPEDQFGLMLLAYAYLLEQQKTGAAQALMEQHLLPWAPTYLDQLSHQTEHDFYHKLAIETKQWLNTLMKDQNLQVAHKRIYFDE